MKDRAILGENGVGKWFFDWPEKEDLYNTEVIGSVDVNRPTGFHVCQHSAIWEDVTGFVDGLQSEEELPNGKYVVCYFYCNKDFDLEQLVDFDITKEQIIENVKNQKYFEGADYYLMKDMEVAK